MRLEEVLREQGRVKAWFQRKMGRARWDIFTNARLWTRDMRQQAATLLGVRVEELFPPEDEPQEKDRLTLEMRLAGMSQRDLAREMGIHESYLSIMRCGKRHWTRNMKELAAKVLEVPVGELFPSEENDGRGDGAGARQGTLPGL